MRRLAVVAGLALFGLGCGAEVVDSSFPPANSFPGEGAGKADVFGRALAGVAAPYPADLELRNQEERLISDMGFRREVAWTILARALEPVPLLGLTGEDEGEEVQLDGEMPMVPRFQTWYGVDDFKRLFQHMYAELSPEDRARRRPFTDDEMTAGFDWNANVLDRSDRWPLERFFKHVEKLGVCPDGAEPEACAQALQSNFSGASGGNARITYSPSTLRHLLTNYGDLIACHESLQTLTFGQEPKSDENFTWCLPTEFGGDAALIKTHWVRADFGRKVPVYDTDGATLARKLASDKTGDWGTGEREADPTPEEIFTIRLRNGDTYRLAALHVMTKELRHWVWVTMWWSDTPDQDFGADRPEEFAALPPVWGHYKMAVTVDYREQDPDPGAVFADRPTLAEALRITAADGISWASNPYIEHGRGNARTNCIGCHQHGGSAVGHDLDGDGILDPFDLERVIDTESLFPSNGREQMREVFPTDYLWSTQRVDNLVQVVRSEVQSFDFQDKDLPEVRAVHILELEADSERGASVFSEQCATCHAKDGSGAFGPSLFERVPTLDDATLVQTLLTGKDAMPSWAHLEDADLAGVAAWLRSSFAR